MADKFRETPITDSLRQIHSEGLNDQATANLAEIAFRQLVADMPEYFDIDGNAYKWKHTTIATSFDNVTSEEPADKTER